jgi:DNA mismatch repair protein MutL
MAQKINRLSETVINQIAAGEVVENPASIVKELIENSLDAGATCISIDFIGGGQQLIRIEDDGCGMSPSDAILSLERHATSKIQDVSDLQSLATMGFRGEALAAISSVSHFEMKTSDGVATRILVEGGKVVAVEPCARNQGTTIEIRSLFYNVPARKKFQKSASANSSQVTRLVETIALAHPQIAFVLNGKELAPTDWQKRIEEILGPHEHEVKGERISGFIAAPSKATLTKVGQYLFINRRPISSPLIAKAVKEAFATRIAEHAYPRFVLFLEIPPDAVDVNVHPQKKEVRFRDESFIFSMVQKAVSKAFAPLPSFTESLVFTPPRLNFSFAEPAVSQESMPVDLPFTYSDRPLAVIGSYLFVQRETLILVDLRAAHARLLFEELRYEKGMSQPLLWPLEFDIEKGEEALVERLNEAGIECRLLKARLVIDALPPMIEGSQFPQFLALFREQKKMEQIATRFCRSLQKSYSMEEADRIWRQVQKCKDGTYDPLGKEIWIEVKEETLWNLFGSKN